MYFSCFKWTLVILTLVMLSAWIRFHHIATTLHLSHPLTHMQVSANANSGCGVALGRRSIVQVDNWPTGRAAFRLLKNNGTVGRRLMSQTSPTELHPLSWRAPSGWAAEDQITAEVSLFVICRWVPLWFSIGYMNDLWLCGDTAWKALFGRLLLSCKSRIGWTWLSRII